LVVEIDGATHSTDEEIRQDALRTVALEEAGYSVLRVTNTEVFENMNGVLETVLARLDGRETL